MRVRVPHLRRAAGREGGWGQNNGRVCAEELLSSRPFGFIARLAGASRAVYPARLCLPTPYHPWGARSASP